MDEIIRVLGTAEVVIFRFMIVPQRLLIDYRGGDDIGPMIRLVPPVRSADERFRSLRQLRPALNPPERITVIHWPKYVDRLESSGVWGAVEQRMAAVAEKAASLAADALCELRRIERAEVFRAIRGEGYQTTWERPG